MCELIDVLTIISEMNHYIKTISYFDNYNDQLIDAICNWWRQNKDVKFYLIHSRPIVIKLSHVVYYIWVQLMCALRAHIKPSIFGNIFSKIEKVVNIFSIFEEFFSKND